MADLPGTPGTAGLHPGLAAALAGRYTIERELGRGGNAVVYLARDLKHDRPVAIKVVLPDLAQSVRTERFLREIQIAAQLTHPLILMLIDSGETASFLYYVMPYVAGESLRDRLLRERQLPLADALSLAREVAEALSYAHEHDVLHRDVKPENILLQGGHAVVADFGVARALSAATSGTVTETGVAVGTPAYMSPEQGTGSKSVDARSDIYGLGCVLYEMLSGHAPFSGETPQEVLARHALDPVPSLKAARPDVPEPVERAVRRALAKAPADRFPTAAAFAAALGVAGGERRSGRRTLAYAGAAFLIVAFGVALATGTLAKRPVEQSVAVLPFLNMSGDTGNEYFSDGMSEELINALVQVEGLRVPARTSAFAFKGKNADIREIGRQLNVSNVVEGSVRRAGNRVHVTAQLIKCADGYHLWSQTYDRELRLRDVVAVQEDIARAIVRALSIKLASGRESTLVRPQTADLGAYQLYLQGRYLWNQRSPASLRQAIQRFEAAIARDSGYALAYAGLADAWWVVRVLNLDVIASSDAATTREGVAALRAVALDPTLAEAHTALGAFREFDWDFVAAEREYRRAIELNPRYAWGHNLYGWMLAQEDRTVEALPEAREARRLDPLSASVNPGMVFLLARRYDDAVAALRTVIDLDPGYSNGHGALGRAYLAKGMTTEAIAELRQAIAAGGRMHERGFIGYALARTGRRDEALKVLAELQQESVGDSLSPRVALQLALIYVGLDQNERALEALLRPELRPGRGYNLGAMRDRAFDPIRSDPRFIGIVKKMGLDR